MLILMSHIFGLLLKHWPLGLRLRGMGKGCWIFIICPNPVVESNSNTTGLWMSLSFVRYLWMMVVSQLGSMNLIKNFFFQLWPEVRQSPPLLHIVTPCACAKGLRNWFCPSVSLSVCSVKNFEISCSQEAAQGTRLSDAILCMRYQ